MLGTNVEMYFIFIVEIKNYSPTYNLSLEHMLILNYSPLFISCPAIANAAVVRSIYYTLNLIIQSLANFM